MRVGRVDVAGEPGERPSMWTVGSRPRWHTAQERIAPSDTSRTAFVTCGQRPATIADADTCRSDRVRDVRARTDQRGRTARNVIRTSIGSDGTSHLDDLLVVLDRRDHVVEAVQQ